MPSTRSSARLGATPQSSSPTSSSKATDATNGRKRKADSLPAQTKKGRKSTEGKKQKTIEQTMPVTEPNDKDDQEEMEVGDEGVEDKEMVDAAKDAENGEEATKDPKNDESAEELPAGATNGMKDETKDEEPSAEAKEEGEGEPADQQAPQYEYAGKPATQDEKDIMQAKPARDEEPKSGIPAAENEKDIVQAKPAKEEEQKPETSTSTMDDTGKIEQNDDAKAEADASTATGGAVEESKERKEAMPSNILEKGIIYFFTRGRVGVDDPQAVQDIARSYIVLRPIPNGAKLGEGTLEDSKNNRLLALPKKVLPKSGRDQFMVFVEKSGATIADLKENVMKGSEYNTKTTGVRHSPAVTPIGEGVYAITTTGRNSHLAYMITIPSEMGEVQKDMGIQQQGSFVTSVKNPDQKGPANTNLPQGPEFPKEIMEEFRGLRWMSMQPKHLDYENAQVLLIGEGQSEEGFAKALEPEAKDEKNEKKATPLEEVKKLEEEDHERVEGLKGDEADAVFADLKLSQEDYPKLMTTW